ncbi:MAG: nucleotidyltransferase domain-containing protein [Thermomicrobiales bacterium]
MRVRNRIEIDDDKLAEICRRYRVRELALFGSVLRDDFRESSDIDVLVEFESDARIGFFELSRLQRELATIIGRDVDIVPKAGLNPVIRKPVIDAAQIIYAI